MEGPNRTEWRGLTCYRYERPQSPQWEEVHSLTLCFVVQGRKRVRIGGTDFFYDPFNYFVMTRGMRFQCEILEASPQKPFVSMLLQADPAAVKRLVADMHHRTLAAYDGPLPAQPEAWVSPIDTELVGATLRFLRALGSDIDRNVLAPIYLQEVLYRVLQDEQRARLSGAAMRESDTNPVAVAIRYMQEDLSRPLSVAELAEAVSMSQSAFAHVFKATTGVAPYQFVKRLRLDRARCMMVEEGASVSEAAATVGYSSLSHFINEFKRCFGVTPGLYADSLRASVPLGVGARTIATA